MRQPIETRFGDQRARRSPIRTACASRWSSARNARAAFTPWDGSPVPGERQVRGLLRRAAVGTATSAPTARFSPARSGFERLGDEGGWTRYGFPDAAGVVDFARRRTRGRGAWGVGSVHHLAWRVDDDAHQD